MKRLGLYLLCALPTPLLAGDVYVGFRVWEAAWSPGAVRQVEKQTTFFNVLNTIQGNDNLSVITADTKTATGTYAGPLITYVTDDKLWSFSAVTMHGQSSPQSTSTSSFVSDTNGSTWGSVKRNRAVPLETMWTWWPHVDSAPTSRPSAASNIRATLTTSVTS